MVFAKNFLEISQDYEYFIFDIWGVIHDGSEAYPNVAHTFRHLKESGKKVCLLSNAPRRSFKVEEILKNFDITHDLYDFILTSGEASYQYLLDNQNNNYSKFGKKYQYIGPEKDLDLLDGLNYNITTNEKEASFVLVTGFDHEDSIIDEKMDDINRAIRENLPMICVNPDMIVVKKTGKAQLCAGQIAKKYKDLGGEVIYFGKPYNTVYDRVFNLFSIENEDRNKIIAIGDGLETDIKGANHYGIKSVFVTSGIISAILGNKYSQLPDRDQLEYQFKVHDAYPDYVIANL